MPKSKYPVACPELILEGQAYKLLSEWWSIRQPVTVIARGCHCEVTISVRPLGIPVVGTIGDAPLTQCERDILELFADSDERKMQSEIIAAMDGIGHGESTTQKALARLVKLGKLDHPPKSRYGYGLIAE